MSTNQKYVGRANYATTSATGHLYRTKVFLLVVRTANKAGQDESQIWHNVYARLQSHYGIRLASFPRRPKESLLRVAERFDLLEQVYNCALAENLLAEL